MRQELYSKKSLTRHLQRKHGEELINCPLCRSTFKHRDNLNRHLKVHSGQKPFACPKCEAKFSFNSNLREHLRGSHKRKTVHLCYYCEKKYSH
ncbi:unnamed protein product [Larinioides sclopetarius]|uniref:C2H2-type domain-containing protein n=1 Tax=Larinioides sclopetarius TaxID=280406 RepID=A0AAV1ZSU0_9ARAC